MKNQYFGDINDYRKYGLLRILTEATRLKIGVCWLLTEDDGGPDGKLRKYLSDPSNYHHYDPILYDKLRRVPQTKCGVDFAKSRGFIPGASYYNMLISDSLQSRQTYFAGIWENLSHCPILFFDPDNGIEVKRPRRGCKGSAKYIYWEEIEQAYRRGHSLVIYQHFPHEPHEAYTAKRVHELSIRLGAPRVDSFATSHVLFLLVINQDHFETFTVSMAKIEDDIKKRWQGQIRPSSPTQKEIDRLWAEEAERRVAQIEKGEVELIPGEEVFDKLRAKFRK